jgi:LPXTG-motif cell wall-anchored protein
MPSLSASGSGGSAGPSQANGTGGSQNAGISPSVFIVGHGNSGSASASSLPSWLIYAGLAVAAVAAFYFMRRK